MLSDISEQHENLAMWFSAFGSWYILMEPTRAGLVLVDPCAPISQVMKLQAQLCQLYLSLPFFFFFVRVTHIYVA